MAISDVSTPELWMVGFIFVILAVAALFEGAILLGVHTLGANESLPAAVTVVGTMLALWWSSDG